MAYKNKVSLRVCGRNMTLAGNESVEYMTKVANYIEEKAQELRNSPSSKNLSPQMISVLTSINIADDYYKCLDEIERIKSLFPKGFNASKAEPGMLFSSEDVEDLKSKIEKLTEDLHKSQEENAVLSQKNMLLSAENKINAENIEKEERDLESKIEIANKEKSFMEDKLSELQEKLKAIEEENNKLKLSFESLEGENKGLKAEVERLKEYEELFENDGEPLEKNKDAESKEVTESINSKEEDISSDDTEFPL